MRHWILTLCLSIATSSTFATTTPVTVRVLARDAKLIGDLSGGVPVRILDAQSGATLAAGMHWGATGSTAKIITEPWVRGDARFDTEGAAAFVTELDLEAPTWVRVEAGPAAGFPNQIATASKTLLLLPGVAVEGNGVVLELNGLLVNLMEPVSEASLVGGGEIEIRSGVKLLCTCPIAPGSLWEEADYDVRAYLYRRDQLVAEAELSYGGETNVFAGTLTLPEVESGSSEILRITVTAANDAEANFGTDSAVFRVRGR